MQAIDMSSAAGMQIVSIPCDNLDRGGNLDSVGGEACTGVVEYGCYPGVLILLLM